MSVTFLFLSTWKAETVVEDKKKATLLISLVLQVINLIIYSLTMYINRERTSETVPSWTADIALVCLRDVPSLLDALIATRKTFFLSTSSYYKLQAHVSCTVHHLGV